MEAMERSIHSGESCVRVGANDYTVIMGSKTNTYHVNMFKKYIAREPEVDVISTSIKHSTSIAAAGMILTQSWGNY